MPPPVLKKRIGKNKRVSGLFGPVPLAERDEDGDLMPPGRRQILYGTVTGSVPGKRGRWTVTWDDVPVGSIVQDDYTSSRLQVIHDAAVGVPGEDAAAMNIPLPDDVTAEVDDGNASSSDDDDGQCEFACHSNDVHHSFFFAFQRSILTHTQTIYL
jgi:hypothetical protein